MTTFDRALKHTLGIEGGFSNDPRDSGGATRYGVTERTARAFGYTGPMSELPIELAKRIYRVQYWDLLKLDDVAERSPGVALEMFDTAVNCGQVVAAKLLQRLLNVFNRGEGDYADITVDGLVGHNTLHALGGFLAKRGDAGSQVLVEALNSLQGAYYVELAERRVKDEAFIYGWFTHRVLKRAV